MLKQALLHINQTTEEVAVPAGFLEELSEDSVHQARLNRVRETYGPESAEADPSLLGRAAGIGHDVVAVCVNGSALEAGREIFRRTFQR